jgi:hypothetical protein
MLGMIEFTAPGDEPGVPLLQLRRWLRDFHQVSTFTVGIFESPILRPTDRREKVRFLMGMTSEAETTMLELGIRAREVGHGEYMIHWTGAGDFRSEEGKAASLEACKRMGWDSKGIDDIADAAGMLNHYTYVHRIEVPWNNAPCLRLRSQRQRE